MCFAVVAPDGGVGVGVAGVLCPVPGVSASADFGALAAGQARHFQLP